MVQPQLTPSQRRRQCLAIAYGEDNALWGWMVKASGVDLAPLGGTVESAVGLLSQPGLFAT